MIRGQQAAGSITSEAATLCLFLGNLPAILCLFLGNLPLKKSVHTRKCLSPLSCLLLTQIPHWRACRLPDMNVFQSPKGILERQCSAAEDRVFCRKKFPIKCCVLQKDKAGVLHVGHLQESQNQDYLVFPQQLAAASPTTPQKHHKRLCCQPQLLLLGAMWER